MDAQRRWIAYDTFKFIVGLILLLLILILLLQLPAAKPTANADENKPVGDVVSSLPESTDTPTLLPTPTKQPSVTPTHVLPTATIAPSATTTSTPVVPSPTSTLEIQPEATATLSPEATATPQPEATATPQPEATATPQPQSVSTDCPLAQPSQLAVGKHALITTNLNLREAAGIDQLIIRVGPPNSTVEIIGGPICIPYQNGAYLWWNVKTSDGITGWSAEASLSKNNYFLQPIP